MRGDDHPLAAGNARRDHLVPVWQHALDGVLRHSVRGQFGRRQRAVAAVVGGVTVVAGLQRGWRHVVAASPQMDLLVTVLRGGFGLVEALQGAVVTLVQAPARMHWNPWLLHLVEHLPEVWTARLSTEVWPRQEKPASFRRRPASAASARP